MEGLRILVIDDEVSVRRFLRRSLGDEGHSVFEAETGAEGLRSVVSHRPDVIILDLSLPDLSGEEVLTRLRSRTSTPVIVLTVHDEEPSKVALLDAGADDYLTKPFGIAELLARIRLVLRRSVEASSAPVFESGGLRIDLGRRLVTIDGSEVSLTPTEYDLLVALARHAGKVLTHHQLVDEVWGAGYGSDSQLLRVNVSHLRRKIEPDPARPRYVVTELGVGYRLRLPD